DYKTKAKEALDERPAELGRAREFSVEMQQLRVHRQCREQHIVHLGDSARHRMLEHLPLGELLEIEACHPSPPADYWPPIIGRRLLALEYGTALFIESGDRLLVLLGEGATRLMRSFELEHRLERLGLGGEQVALHVAKRDTGAVGDAPGQRRRLGL